MVKGGMKTRLGKMGNQQPKSFRKLIEAARGKGSTARDIYSYTRVGGNREHPVMDGDIASTLRKRKAVFYVYVYLDSRKPGKYSYGRFSFNYEPFYVGKGKRYRDIFHLSRVINGKRNLISPLLFTRIEALLKRNVIPFVIRVGDRLTESGSLKLEKEVIKIIGRVEYGNGPLLNQTAGGQGTSDRIYSDKTRAKIKANHADFRGRKSAWWGKTHSEETKKLIGFRSSQRRHTQETKDKIRAKMLDRKMTHEHKRKLAMHLDRVCPFRKNMTRYKNKKR